MVVLAVLLASVARVARAAAPEPVRVLYRVPESCPDQATFEAVFAEHLGTATLARFDELARNLTVVIDNRDGSFYASVELVDREGQAASREVAAPTCDQAMRAIALAAALAARSQAERTVETPEAPIPPPIARPAPASSAAPANESRAEKASNERPLESATPETPVRDVGALVERDISTGLSLSTGVGPGVAPGLVLAGRWGVAGKMGRSLVLAGIVNDTFRTSLNVGDVRLRVIKGRLEACPFEPSISDRWRFSACPGFEIGSHSGFGYEDGENVATSRTEARLWAAVTLAARVRLRAGRFAAALGPELGVPLTRNRFALAEPVRPVYEVPDVVVGVTATGGGAW